MERWRSFFALAEEDLWTVIHQAILLAAADFPAEFKHKRSEIAEILFARRSYLSPPTLSVHATMISGSVITNETGNRERKAPHEACWQEDNVLRHCNTSRDEVKAVDTLSHGPSFKSFAVERHSLKEDKPAELDTCLRSYNGFKDIPEAACGLAMECTILQGVKTIKDRIMANQSEDGLFRSLRALEDVDITVDILKATDIGREVNKFRKHPSVPIQNLAKQLVRSWKGMVDKWVNKTEILHPLSASGEQETSEVLAVRDTSLQFETSAHRSLHLAKQSLSKSTLDCTSTIRAPLQSEHAVEEMGSSRVESDELYRPGFVERRANLCEQQAQLSRCIATQGSKGPGRPANRTAETERNLINGTLACEHFKKAEEKSRSCVQNFSTEDCKRPEVMKRWLSTEYQHVERAKKQRDMPPSSRPELCKSNVMSARIPICVKSEACFQRR
ncbi:hypothetical protein L7F22_012611 [Adiantum nelumboides]|nr:hypothetical protein [Adiantum nelumboides]